MVLCSVLKGMPIINLINELVGQCGRGVLAVVGGVAGMREVGMCGLRC